MGVIYEDENVIVFLDHMPINPGHVLICPKYPYETIREIPKPLLDRITEITRKVYDQLEKHYKCDGITVMQNNGVFNDLNHFHLHIFPRYEGDGFSWNFKEDSVWSQK